MHGGCESGLIFSQVSSPIPPQPDTLQMTAQWRPWDKPCLDCNKYGPGMACVNCCAGVETLDELRANPWMAVTDTCTFCKGTYCIHHLLYTVMPMGTTLYGRQTAATCLACLCDRKSAAAVRHCDACDRNVGWGADGTPEWTVSVDGKGRAVITCGNCSVCPNFAQCGEFSSAGPGTRRSDCELRDGWDEPPSKRRRGTPAEVLRQDQLESRRESSGVVAVCSSRGCERAPRIPCAVDGCVQAVCSPHCAPAHVDEGVWDMLVPPLHEPALGPSQYYCKEHQSAAKCPMPKTPCGHCDTCGSDLYRDGLQSEPVQKMLRAHSIYSKCSACGYPVPV
jgi:hypothetical protein